MNGRKLLACLLAVLLAGNGLSVSAYAGRSAADNVAPEAYLEAYPAEAERVQAVSPLTAGAPVDSVLQGKSILFVGDSLTAGYGLADPGQSWVHLMETKYGMDVTICSVSGSTFVTAEEKEYKPGGCFQPYVERELPEGTFDLVFVEGGGNDWRCAAPLGDDYESRDPRNFKGAMNVLIDRLQERYPKAEVVFMTSWATIERESPGDAAEMEYYQAMLALCRLRNIACFAAVDPQVSGIYANDPAFRKQYFLTEDDPWHLNTAGQALFLPTIAGWLETQVRQRVLVAGFLDVKRQQWFADTVQYAVDKKLMNGLETDQFGPDAQMTRGMLVTVLYRAAGSPEVTGLSQPFADVPEERYYRDAVCWCYHQGMVTGKDESHFDPEGNITREQMAAILYRQRVSARVPETAELPENLRKFTDGVQANGYARVPLSWAVEQGIIQGMDAYAVAPQGYASRAQVATMLQRYLEA